MHPSPGHVKSSTPDPPLSCAAARVARSSPGSVPDTSPAGVPNVTALLQAWGAGDRVALEALVPAVYAELQRQARRALRRETAGHTLSTTALVHEAYLRLVAPGGGAPGGAWQDRAQFFGIAAHLMRQVLVDHARTRNAAKRGGGAVAVTLGHARDVAAPDAGTDHAADVVAVHEALERLAALDPEQARLVELRYFGGLTLEETGAVLGVSAATVKREWAVARAWLRRELAGQ